MNITDEAVEAAAISMYGRLAMTKWEHLGPLTKQTYFNAARSALEAAAAHMLAEAWSEGFTDAYYQERGYDLDGRQAYVLPDSLVDDAKAWNRYRPTP